MQDVCDKKMSFTELLSHAVAMYLKHGPESDDEGGGYVLEGDTEDWEDVDDFAYHDEVDAGKGHKEFDAVEEEFATKKFLEIGSPAASLRLLKARSPRYRPAHDARTSRISAARATRSSVSPPRPSWSAGSRCACTAPCACRSPWQREPLPLGGAPVWLRRRPRARP